MNLIPCEICNIQVPFETYIEHLEVCTMRHMHRMQNPQYRTQFHQNRLNINNPTLTQPSPSPSQSQSPSQQQQQSQGGSSTTTTASIGVHIIPSPTASDLMLRQRMTIRDPNSFTNNVVHQGDNVDLNRLLQELLSITVSSSNQIRFMSIEQENDYELNSMLEELTGGNVVVRVNDVSNAYSVIEWTENTSSNVTTESQQNEDVNPVNDEHEDEHQKQEKKDEDEDEEDPLTCRICFDERKRIDCANTKVYVKTVCAHIYCKECIDKWLNLNHKCPTCMHDFNES